MDEIEAKARLAAAKSEIARLREALEWYGENARLARLIHSEGDQGRHAIAEDGGKRARAALAETAAPAAPDSDGWIKWEGGTSPVSSGATVDVKFRSGIHAEKIMAGNLYWEHDNISSDIVAYRIVGARDG